MNKIYQKIFPGGRNAGFTLIELLVVVLIIGVLTSVALPQYEMAVMKSRFVSGLTVAENLKKAEEIYYIANGYYEANTENLDLDYKHSCTGSDVLTCQKFFRVDLLGGSGIVTEPRRMWIKLSYYPEGYVGDTTSGIPDYEYYVWLNNSAYPNERMCQARTDKGRRFCKMMNAE